MFRNLFSYIYLYNLYVMILPMGFMYHYPLILFICIFIYSFIYWKSGICDLLVLMLFGLQSANYELNF